MKERYIVMDAALCHDCNNCFMACTDEHAEEDWTPYQKPMPRHGHRWMNIQRRERGQGSRIDAAFLPTPCMQCGDAPCEKGADFARRREDGIVTFDLAGGAGKDVSALCPYGAIWWNAEENVSQKCDFCAHLLDDAGWEPAVPRCVHSCPTGALKFYTEEASEFEKRVRKEGLEAYRAELGTRPHVWYKNLHRFTKNFVTGQLLRDGDVAKYALMRLEGEGVNAEQLSDMFGEYKFDGLADGEYVVFAEGCEIARATVAGASVDLGEYAL